MESILFDDDDSSEDENAAPTPAPVAVAPPAAPVPQKPVAPPSASPMATARPPSQSSRASAPPPAPPYVPPVATAPAYVARTAPYNPQPAPAPAPSRPSYPPATTNRAPPPAAGAFDFDMIEPTPIAQFRAPGVTSSGPTPTAAAPPLQTQQPPPRMAPSAVPSASTSASAAAVVATGTRPAPVKSDSDRRKEQFLMFTRVLMKYLEQKDPAMHQHARAIIKSCAEKHKNKQPGYESLTSSMHVNLKKAVGEAYWKKAEALLIHFLRNRKAQQQAEAGKTPVLTTNPMMAPPPVTSATLPLPPVVPVSSSVAPQRPSSSSSQPSVASVPSEMRRKQEEQLALQQLKDKSSAAILAAQQKRDLIRQASSSKVPAKVPPPMPVPAPIVPPVPTPLPKPVVPPLVTTPTPMVAPATTPLSANSTKTPTNTSKTVPKKKPPAKKKPAEKKRKDSDATSSQTKATPPTAPPVVVAPIAPSEHKIETKLAPKMMFDKKKVEDRREKIAPSTKLEAKKPESALKHANPPKVYEEWMDEVDHAISYNWKNAASLLSKDFLSEINITDEQHILLYGEAPPKEAPPRPGFATAIPSSASIESMSSSKLITDDNDQTWSDRNLIDCRMAWAIVRLPEQELTQKQPNQQHTKPSEPTIDAWENDSKALNDPVLELLSNATQQYLKSILSSSIQVAKRRCNVDGIRLWHMQHAHAKKVHASLSDDTGTIPRPPPPPLTLRLGCDVTRQMAMIYGNAAKVSQRMEEAVARSAATSSSNTLNSDLAVVDQDGTLIDPEILELESKQEQEKQFCKAFVEATSMGDLSKRVYLEDAKELAEDAAYHAGKFFEVYGGKHASEPPFGRVPKKQKFQVTIQDLNACSQLGKIKGQRMIASRQLCK